MASILMRDRSAERWQPAGDIAMVFQNYALYPHMSVYDNIAYSLKIKGVPKKEIGGESCACGAYSGAGIGIKKKPSQLSGGQKQRVAMGLP